jgi:hypothetical protein
LVTVFMLLCSLILGVGRGPLPTECRQARIPQVEARAIIILGEGEKISKYFSRPYFFFFVKPQDVVGDGVHPCILGLDTAWFPGGVAIAGLGTYLSKKQ